MKSSLSALLVRGRAHLEQPLHTDSWLQLHCTNLFKKYLPGVACILDPYGVHTMT